MLKFQPGPWLKRCVSLRAHVVWCLLLLLRWPESGETVMFVVAVFSMVGCWSQPHWDAARASLLQRTWWRCRPDLPPCWSWGFARRHWAPIVGQRDVSTRCVLLSLMIQSVLPCFSHLKSPCRSWYWLSSCWVLPSRSFECVVLLLLLCWWRRVLLLCCWVLLLIVCGCRSVSLRPWTWWQSP